MPKRTIEAGSMENTISQILKHGSQKEVPKNKRFGFSECLQMKPKRIIFELEKTDEKQKKNFSLLYLLEDLIKSIGIERYTDLINIILIEIQKPMKERKVARVIATYENDL